MVIVVEVDRGEVEYREVIFIPSRAPSSEPTRHEAAKRVK
jgi:hypothetical protein